MKLKNPIPVVGKMPATDYDLLRRLARRRQAELIQTKRPADLLRRLQPIAPFAL